MTQKRFAGEPGTDERSCESGNGPSTRKYGSAADPWRQQDRDGVLEEEVRRRTRELEAANRELEAFAYSVSHDLRAPLRAINGFSQIILRNHKEELTEKVGHYFENILEASTHMGELIEDLLRYSRLGRRAQRSAPVSLREFLLDAWDGLEGRAAAPGAELNLPDVMPTVKTDPQILGCLIENLLDNAVKYVPADISPRIRIDVAETGADYIISVADNGIGIAPEYHEKIFTVFQRLHGRTAYPGTGIGLAIVKKSATLLGGSVRVASEPGKGAVFSVRIPAR